MDVDLELDLSFLQIPEVMQMKIIDHAAAALEEWRQGVTTKMRISAISNARQLCIFEQ